MLLFFAFIFLFIFLLIIIMSNYKYSQSWFINSEINCKMSFFCDVKKENNILEIGCFEGLSSIFFC
jgi:hypothetical protein